MDETIFEKDVEVQIVVVCKVLERIFTDVPILLNRKRLWYQNHSLTFLNCIQDESSRFYCFSENFKFKHNCA